MKKTHTEITVVIDRIENGFAYLQFSDGRTVAWPADKLPEGCVEGDVIKIAMQISEEIKEKREKSIKKLYRGNAEEGK